MNYIKSVFSIKDLENFSGIKAHTIRIWEKRYDLLEPDRTTTNIRQYSLDSLKKLLNISLLNKEGFKISKIAKLDQNTFEKELDKAIYNKTNKTLFINQLKIAMLNFDTFLFEETYKEISKVVSFSDIFKNYFIPFLKDIGLLWQSGAINPGHEHFISNLIKQKLILETHHQQHKQTTKHHKVFVLFLPEDEIHDLGLTYIHYETLKAGYKSIFLGPSVPMSVLSQFLNNEQEIVFVSYFTIKPDKDKLPMYLKNFSNELLVNKNAQFCVLGTQIATIDSSNNTPDKIKLYSSLDSIIEQIKKD